MQGHPLGLALVGLLILAICLNKRTTASRSFVDPSQIASALPTIASLSLSTLDGVRALVTSMFKILQICITLELQDLKSPARMRLN
jgi:hypothetical protein